MRALQVARLSDDYSGVAIAECARPIPGPGEVLIRVRAASLNYPDLLMSRGAYQMKPDLPFTLGGDLAGEIEAVRVIAASTSDAKLAEIERLHDPDAVLNISGGFRDRVKELTGGGADIVFDPVNGDVFEESMRCLAFDGRLLVIGFTGGRIATLPTIV